MNRGAFHGTAIVAVVLAACGAACSSSSSSLASGAGPTGPVAIHPANLFTGFDDGTVDFKVPATLVNVGADVTVKWTVVDDSLATVAIEQPPAGTKATASNSHHATVVTKKSGKTTLRAIAGGTTYNVPLTITQYAPGARDLGNDLYQVDRSAQSADNPGTKALGCVACHGNQGTARHSPSEIGGFDDAAVLKVIATATKPDGSVANGGTHKYALDTTEQQGILARLRSLEPLDYAK